MKDIKLAIKIKQKLSNEVKAKALKAAGDIIASSVSDTAPVNSGLLSKSIKAVDAGGGAVVIKVENAEAEKYAAFQEYGTKYIEGRGFISRGFKRSVNNALAKAVSVLKNQL